MRNKIMKKRIASIATAAVMSASCTIGTLSNGFAFLTGGVSMTAFAAESAARSGTRIRDDDVDSAAFYPHAYRGNKQNNLRTEGALRRFRKRQYHPPHKGARAGADPAFRFRRAPRGGACAEA